MYVFGFIDNPTYRTIAGSDWGDVCFASPNFFCWLIANMHVHEIKADDAQSGDLIMYFCRGQWKHVGRLVVSGRIVSKWGVGLLYEHERLEVPEQYGNEIRFFRSISTETALEHFIAFAESQGAPVRRLLAE